MIKKYHNLYQIINDYSNIDSISSINSTEFDLSFFKTNFDTALGRFVASDDESIIDNKQVLGMLYLEERLNDFVEYWKSIELILSDKITTRSDWDYYYLIKLNMIKILETYSTYKGTEAYIKFVYNLYSHLTTFDFWKIQSVNFEKIPEYCNIFSNFKNMEYNIRGGLPNYIWVSIIKPTCHPAGWVCNYYGNEYVDDFNIVSYDNNIRNDLCYIDFVGCNNINNSRYPETFRFDNLNIYQRDLVRLSKINWQVDNLTIQI